MTRIRTLALAAALSFAPTLAPAQSTSDDAAVRAVIQQYFRGHATGDSAVMRKAFHPTAHIEGIRGGAFSSWTLNEYVGNMGGTPAPDESSRRRSIDSVDLMGTAAMAKATLVHGAVTFTDYFVLLKVNGVWGIANKVYYAERRGT